MRAQFAVLGANILSVVSTGLADSPQAVLSPWKNAFSQPKDSPQLVNLAYARYEGNYNSASNITDFFGIRYAAPPTRGNRFQAPKDPLYQTGVTKADIIPNQCPQATQGHFLPNPIEPVIHVLEGFSPGRQRLETPSKRSDGEIEIEDCLFLNVHVSGEINEKAKMPVVVWIHGGGYVEGDTSKMDGAFLINEAGGGIVAVEVQYRLGVFGFLAGAEVKKRGALNAGLLDQQKALQWVQRYIDRFGGDPHQVTIWGESAGAGSVLQHLVAHRGNTPKPLFRRAITSSTFLPNQYHFDDKVPEDIYAEVANLMGCSKEKDTFACLVAAKASDLEVVNRQVCGDGFWGTFVTVPVVDGEFIMERPIETIKKGKLNSDDILMMTNADEGYIFVHGPTRRRPMTLKEYVGYLMPSFDDTQKQRIVDLYEGAGFNTVRDQASAVMGEAIFVCPTYAVLNSFKGTARKGLFAIPPATHGMDLPYYFPETGTQAFDNGEFRASFVGAFTRMIKFGDPNMHREGVITPDWPVYRRGHSDTEMLFNRTGGCQPNITTIPTDPKLLERCGVWEKLAPVIPQ